MISPKSSQLSPLNRENEHAIALDPAMADAVENLGVDYLNLGDGFTRIPSLIDSPQGFREDLSKAGLPEE